MTAQFIGAPLATCEAEGFSIGHWSVDRAGDDVPAHGHAQAHFMYVVSGDYFTRAAGHVAPGRGPLVFNPPGTWHCDRFASPAGSFLSISIATAGFDTAAAEVALPPSSIHVTDFTAHALVGQLLRCCAAPNDHDSRAIRTSLCLELLAATEARGSRERRRPRWLARVCELLRASACDQDLSIDALARVAGVHEVHLARTFRRFHRCTPGEYLRACRIGRVAQLLVATQLPLAQISQETGFTDQSHMTRHFRRAFGVTPATYRLTVAGKRRRLLSY